MIWSNHYHKIECYLVPCSLMLSLQSDGPPTRWGRAIQPSREDSHMFNCQPLDHWFIVNLWGVWNEYRQLVRFGFGEMNEHEWTPLSFLVEPVYFFTPFPRNNRKSFFIWLRFNCAEKFGKEFGAGLVGCSFHRSGWFLEPHFSQNPQEFIFWAER